MQSIWKVEVFIVPAADRACSCETYWSEISSKRWKKRRRTRFRGRHLCWEAVRHINGAVVSNNEDAIDLKAWASSVDCVSKGRPW